MTDIFGTHPIRFKNVLVLDDETDVCHALKDLLETSFEGVSVYAATSPTEALGVLASRGADLIITDYRMPKMDGLEFLAAASRVRPGVPHIMLTAYDTEVVKRRGLRGAGRLLQKPMEPATVLAEVRQMAEASPPQGQVALR